MSLRGGVADEAISCYQAIASCEEIALCAATYPPGRGTRFSTSLICLPQSHKGMISHRGAEIFLFFSVTLRLCGRTALHQFSTHLISNSLISEFSPKPIPLLPPLLASLMLFMDLLHMIRFLLNRGFEP